MLGSWQYGFTEMFNNAIEHSGGSRIIVQIEGTFARTEMMISDDGYGIFRKIKEEVGLPDERHAVLELAKGKLTTDPDHHTGEGIFFTSRIFDSFEILSGKDYFSHRFEDPKDWIMESSSSHGGTYVRMRLDNHSSRTAKEIFDQFTSGDDYGFTKTIIPLRMMASSGGDRLISRSQARRVLARIELFRTVLFDFSDVESIGQAFADEIFRVFARQHPEIELIPINASSETRKMISRASGGG